MTVCDLGCPIKEASLASGYYIHVVKTGAVLRYTQGDGDCVSFPGSRQGGPKQPVWLNFSAILLFLIVGAILIIAIFDIVVIFVTIAMIMVVMTIPAQRGYRPSCSGGVCRMTTKRLSGWYCRKHVEDDETQSNASGRVITRTHLQHGEKDVFISNP